MNLVATPPCSARAAQWTTSGSTYTCVSHTPYRMHITIHVPRSRSRLSNGAPKPSPRLDKVIFLQKGEADAAIPRRCLGAIAAI